MAANPGALPRWARRSSDPHRSVPRSSPIRTGVRSKPYLAPPRPIASQVRLAGFTVTLDPLASLRRWKPVVALKFRGLEAQLQRNDAGRYWTFGGSKSNDPPPNLELRYSFAQPARFTLNPGGDQLALQSRGAIRLDDSSFQTSSSLSWLGTSGDVAFGRQWSLGSTPVRPSKSCQVHSIGQACDLHAVGGRCCCWWAAGW